MEKKKIILSNWKTGPIQSDTDILKLYSEMLANAEVNIGRITVNDVLITENFVKNLREIKNKLVGKLVKKHIQKGENNGQSNRYGKRHSVIKIEV